MSGGHAMPAGNGKGKATAGVPAVVPPDEDDFLTRMARDPSIDAVKLQGLWAVRKDIEATRAKADFYDAMANAQAEFPTIGRDANNEQTKSKYARFESIWDLCCPVWTRHGFAVRFEMITTPEGMIRPSIVVSHRGGHVETTQGPDTPPDNAGAKGTVNKTMVQANQSTVTYVKRGLLCSAMGIVTRYEDDDGQTSSRGGPNDRQGGGSAGASRQATALSWCDMAHARLSTAPTHEVWFKVLAEELPKSPSAGETTRLANTLKSYIEKGPPAFRARARGLFRDRLEAFGDARETKRETASDKPSDAPRGSMRAAAAQVMAEKKQAAGTVTNGEPLTADEQWAEDTISNLLLITELEAYYAFANQPDTQSTMKRFARENRALFVRVRDEFDARYTRITGERP